MINKKAQLGKIITTLPVMILLILIMAMFVALSAGAFLFNGKTQPSPAKFIIASNNLLFKTIEIKLNDNTIKEMLIIEAIIESINGKTTQEEIDKGLEQFLTRLNNCAFITIDGGIIAQAKQNTDGTIKDIETFGSSIDNKKIMRKIISLNGEEYKIESYYGECKDE